VFSYELKRLLWLVLISLGAPEVRQVDESTLANPESLTELLRVPSLRSVSFFSFNFTHALCQAAANALVEGTAITNLDFFKCSFSALESAAILANGFSINTSVIPIKVTSPWDEALNGALGVTLPSNSTLQELDFDLRYDSNPIIHVDWQPICVALRENTALKSLKAVCESVDESLCTAIKDGLGRNEALESLDLTNIFLRDDNSDLWCRAFAFLRTNTALKSLAVDITNMAMASPWVSTLRSDIVAMLPDNTSLQSLYILSWNTETNIDVKEYIVHVTALQHNTTLKSLNFHSDFKIQLNDAESKRMASLLNPSTFIATSKFS
jgi:hypothetical protein